SAYDPAAMERARAELNDNAVKFARDAYEAATGADALLILTDWEEFAALDLDRICALLKYPVVLDGRNLYRPEVMAQHGLTYVSVGRGTIAAPERRAAANSANQSAAKSAAAAPSATQSATHSTNPAQK